MSQEDKQKYYSTEFISYTKRNNVNRPPRNPFFEFMAKERALISDKMKMEKTSTYISSMLTDKWREMNEEERSAYLTKEYHTFQLSKKKKSKILKEKKFDLSKMSSILPSISANSASVGSSIGSSFGPIIYTP